MKHFLKIISDNKSGSVKIVNNLIEELKNIIKSDTDIIIEDSIIKDLTAVLNHHRGMLVLFHFINEFLLKIEENCSRELLLTFLNDYKIKWQNVNREIIKNILSENDFADKKIFLHSNSSTVIELFREIGSQGNSVEVFQTISYPVKEGALQADEISKAGIKVNIITDGAAADYLQQIDFFICGADAILKNSFVNKAGTYLYSLACKQFEKPVYILSDSRKIINEDYLPLKLRKIYTEFKNNSSDEIWKSPPENINIFNYYFEKTPLEYISKIYTEREILLPEEILEKDMETGISPFLL